MPRRARSPPPPPHQDLAAFLVALALACRSQPTLNLPPPLPFFGPLAPAPLDGDDGQGPPAARRQRLVKNGDQKDQKDKKDKKDQKPGPDRSKDGRGGGSDRGQGGGRGRGGGGGRPLPVA